jgi:hypothetical protein
MRIIVKKMSNARMDIHPGATNQNRKRSLVVRVFWICGGREQTFLFGYAVLLLARSSPELAVMPQEVSGSLLNAFSSWR